jgi:pimeloyl-ACP methyl ester carboxylesterase
MLVTINGAELSYETFGEGEPLLWLHGLMGAGSDWKYLFDRPPQGYRLIAPDLRGHGSSTNPQESFSFRQCAADVRGLLGNLGIERVNAIGLSGGGIALLHLATLVPEVVRRMVIVSAPPYFPEQARRVQRDASPSMLSAPELAAMWARHPGGAAQIDRLFEDARKLADRYDDVSFTPPWLAQIQAETLIVFGDRDFLYPASLAFDLYDAIPKSYLWVVPNAGHAPVFGAQASQFRETVMAFLDGDWFASA